ncbi:MAG TPA: hypothetical protein VL307_18325 [Chitinophagaceae bacterium]|nr:hypothetical protein [Chitinophagaceae bacterium]
MLDYYTNTAAFAKNCENKARPMMHCNGKCQMMKKLKEEEKKEQQAPERKNSHKIEIVSSKSFFTSFVFADFSTLQPIFSFYHFPFSTGFYPDIFHPPGLV